MLNGRKSGAGNVIGTCLSEGKDVATIQTENQFFSYDWVLFLEEAITTISKFGCSVSRSTEENNKHSFKPE